MTSTRFPTARLPFVLFAPLVLLALFVFLAPLLLLARPAAPREGEGDPGGDPGASADSLPVFHFHDQSKVAGLPDFASLPVETSYGVLLIPRSEIVQVRFARRLPPELEERIARLVAELASEDFDTRKRAADLLKEIGAPAARLVERALKSENETVRKLAEDVIKEIRAESGKGGARLEGALPALAGADDEVVTLRMTLKGRVAQEEFLIRSRYGELRVTSAALSGIVFQGRAREAVKEAVEASFQPPASWKKTKLEIEKGDRFRITATGQISVDNYSVMSGPEGVQGYPNSFQGFPALALVGKVGKNGTPFVVGSSYKGKATHAGALHLSVVSFMWNPGGAQGAYQVKAETDER
jgi:hypothetical protein